MIFQNSLGIDIRSESIALASMRATLAGIQGGPMRCHAFPPGLTWPEKIKQSSEVITAFIETNRIENPEITLAVPRELYIVREIFFPSVVKDNIRGTLTYELERYIPFPENEVYFDPFIIAENKTTNQIRVLLVAIRKKDLDEFLPLSDLISKKFSGIDFRPFALAGFITVNAKKSRDAVDAFLYYDGDGTELCFTSKGHVVYARYFKGKEPDTDGIIGAINESRKHLKTQEAPVNMGVFETAIPQEVFNRLTEDPEINLHTLGAIGETSASGDFVSAQALAISGASQDRNRFNLLPKPYRKRPARMPYYLLIGLTGLVLLAGVAWGGSVFMRRQMDLTKLDAELTRLKPDVERIRKIESELSQAQKTVGEISRLRKLRIFSLDILKELTQLIPPDAWITSLEYKKKEIQIEGIAAKGTDLIPLIEASPLFAETKLLSAIARETSGKERFRIGFKVVHRDQSASK